MFAVLTDKLQASIDGNSVNPGFVGRLPLKFIEPAPDVYENFL
jgi:hypothetical protein